MSKELSTKHKWIIAIAILLSVVAITLSIVSICKTYPTQNQGLDYWGLILGVLALLITILVGWQIFSIINFQSAQKEIQDAKTSFQKAEEEIRNSHNEIKVLHKEAEELKDKAEEFYTKTAGSIIQAAARVHWTAAINTNDRFNNEFPVYVSNICLAIDMCCKAKDIPAANFLILDILETAQKAPSKRHKYLLIKSVVKGIKNNIELLSTDLVTELTDLYNEIPLEEREASSSNEPTE